MKTLKHILIGILIGSIMSATFLYADPVNYFVGINVWDGSTWRRASGSATGVINVSSTSTGGSVTPADTFANPTTAQSTFSLNGGFNGTTWDRLRAVTSEQDGLIGGLGILEVQTIPREFNIGGSYDRIRHSFFQSTTGVVANGAGTSVDMTTTPMTKFTLIVDRTVGATDVVNIILQCSIDGVIWPNVIFPTATIGTLASEPALNNTGSAITEGPCRFMRYNVVTVGAGNTLTIQILATR